MSKNNLEPTDLPTANLIRTFATLSICLALTYIFSLFAIALGIIAVIFASKRTRLYKANVQKYRETSFKKIRKYRTIAIIGIVLATLLLFGVGFYTNVVNRNNWTEDINTEQYDHRY
jgi:uncharacterized membrane protein